MSQVIKPGTQTITCEQCGCAAPDYEVRGKWHCLSLGVLGETDVSWYCPKCYAAAFQRPRDKEERSGVFTVKPVV